MTAERPVLVTMDDYLATVPEPVRPVLQQIRQAIRVAVPDATETISYRLPAFRLRRTFIYFAAFKRHVGIYPPVVDDAVLVTELARFRGDKGNLSFPLDQPMPIELIGRVAVALSRQYR